MRKRFAMIMRIMPLIILFLITNNGYTFAETKSTVDVGLIFGANNQFPIGVYSDTGFVFGISEDDVFETYLDLSAYKSLMIYKDGYYEPSGRTLVSTAQNYYINGQVKPGYHVQIVDIYSSYDEAMSMFLTISAAVNDAYLVYDDGWRIFAGQFLTAEEATAGLNVLKSNLPDIKLMVADPSPSRVIIGTKEQVIFSYDSTEKNFGFKASIFELAGVKYRNGFIVKRLPGSDFTFINRVTLSEYLYGVLPKELGGNWPIETLKAQAIASRNYVLSAPDKFAAYGFDVCSTVNSQVYGGYSVEHPNTNLAVDQTVGQVLVSEGKVVPLYFHSHSGGITDNSENVWSSALPYIKSTLDLYSIGAVGTDWNTTLNRADIEAKLIIAGYNIGSLKSLNILERSPSGRVAKMAFVGSASTATLTKDKIRSVLGSTVIKSLLFSFDSATAVTPEALKNASTSNTLSTTSDVASKPSLNDNQAIAPKVLLSGGGIYGAFIDKGRLIITENGTEKTVTVDKATLIQKSDIYSNPLPIVVPYLYNSTESFDMSSGSVIFYGHGYGHGLGMSQWGARKMAELGKTYEEILLFYYKGTSLIKY